MGRRGQTLVRVQGAQPGVHLVAVRARVAVVGRLGQIVGHHRSHPHRADAEFCEVVQLRLHAGQVSAMAGVHLVSVDAALQLSRHVVVGRVAVCKPIWHDEVHGGSVFPTVKSVVRQRRDDLKRKGRPTPPLWQHVQGDFTGLLDPGHIQFNPDVAGQGGGAPIEQGHPLALRFHALWNTKVGMRDQDFHLSFFQVAPPSRRVDMPGLGNRGQGAQAQGECASNVVDSVVHDFAKIGF